MKLSIMIPTVEKYPGKFLVEASNANWVQAISGWHIVGACPKMKD